jgi:hypothetical protein
MGALDSRLFLERRNFLRTLLGMIISDNPLEVFYLIKQDVDLLIFLA